ncbi:MAG: heme-dependent oxidative N-demethylase family protein [Ilumatobacteraceae bacterium]
MALAEPDYQPYQAGEFRWRLGLRVLALADWIQIGPAYDRDLAAKRDALANHPATVLAYEPGVEHEAAEVLDALVAHLTRRWPEWFVVDGDATGGATVANLRTGETFEYGARPDARPDARHLLDIAGRLVQEDLVLLVERPGGLTVGGGSVCFPNRWSLASKLGLRLPEVHAPVSRLNDQLGGSVDTFFARLGPERSFWRLGWSVLDTGELYQPTDGTAPPVDPLPDVELAGERLFLRVERETFRRFPVTGCVLFTLRTYVRPLAHLAARPDDARRLADALQAMPDDVADYKKVAELTPTAVAWLTAVTAGSTLEADGS